MTERKASMGDKVYRGDVVKFIRNNISLGTFMKRTIKTADEACWDLCDKLNYVPAIEESNEPHWIPVTERLPKEEGFYLVTLEDKCGAETTIRFFRIENGERYWSLWGNENITAWMPKPEPYKEVTE